MCLCFRDAAHGMKAQLGWEQRRSLMFGALRVSVGVSGAGWKESREGQGLRRSSPGAFLFWISPSIAGAKLRCSYAVLCGAGTQGLMHTSQSPGWHWGCFAIIVLIQGLTQIHTEKTFISVTFCGCSCCAVRLSSSLSVLWSGRVLLHGLSQVMWAVLKLNSPPWARASLRVPLRSGTFLAIHVPSAIFFVDTILQLHAAGYS